MTPSEARKQLHRKLAESRALLIAHLGTGMVAWIEGLGFRIVPAGLIEVLEKVVALAAKETEPPQ